MADKAEKAEKEAVVEDLRPLNVHPDAAVAQRKPRHYLMRHESAPLMREVDDTEYRELVTGDNGHQWRIAKYWEVDS